MLHCFIERNANLRRSALSALRLLRVMYFCVHSPQTSAAFAHNLYLRVLTVTFIGLFGRNAYKGASCVLTSSKRAEAGRRTSRAYLPSPPCGFSSSPKISCGHFWGCPCLNSSLRRLRRLRVSTATVFQNNLRSIQRVHAP